MSEQRLAYCEALRNHPGNQSPESQSIIDLIEELLITQGIKGLIFVKSEIKVSGVSYGQALRQFRRSQEVNLTQRRLAALTQGKVSHSYIAMLERGEIGNPSATKIWVLEDVLNCPRGGLTEFATRLESQKTS